jgi:hypothetical protein
VVSRCLLPKARQQHNQLAQNVTSVLLMVTGHLSMTQEGLPYNHCLFIHLLFFFILNLSSSSPSSSSSPYSFLSPLSYLFRWVVIPGLPHPSLTVSAPAQCPGVLVPLLGLRHSLSVHPPCRMTQFCLPGWIWGWWPPPHGCS